MWGGESRPVVHCDMISQLYPLYAPIRCSQAMDFTAECFDAPPDSEKHVAPRDSAWMGGDLVEGRYLLGMLIGENLFKVADEEYVRKLRDFISRNVSAALWLTSFE